MPLASRFLTSNPFQTSSSADSKVRPQSMRSVLVLGGAGYLGSVMVGRLLQRGFHVRVLDAFLFGDRSLSEFKPSPSFELIRGDIRNIEVVQRSMKGSDAVIHLAAIVGDSACDDQQSSAIEINRET